MDPCGVSGVMSMCDAATARGENLFAPLSDIAPHSLSVHERGAVRDIRNDG
jgi:hypothetical protein